MPRFEKKSIGFWVLNQYLTQGFPLHRNQKGVEENQAREGNGRLWAGKGTKKLQIAPSKGRGFSGFASMTHREVTGTVKSLSETVSQRDLLQARLEHHCAPEPGQALSPPTAITPVSDPVAFQTRGVTNCPLDAATTPSEDRVGGNSVVPSHM